MRKDQVFSKDGVILSETIVEFTADEIRAKRNSLLAETDYLAPVSYTHLTLPTKA